MKCEICKKNVAETFLKKKLGSFVKDEKGKMHLVCGECQSKLPTKADVLKNI
jgi:hypothetical protein